MVPMVYVPDFMLPNGTWVEIKGLLDDVDLKKIIAFRDAGHRIIVGLQKPNVKFNKSKTTTIEMKLEQYKIPYFYVRESDY